MTNREIILGYATSNGGNIVRKDFVPWFESAYPDGSVRSIDTELRQMVSAGVLKRIRNGRFCLIPDARIPYVPVISQEMKTLFQRIKDLYPYVDFCILQGRTVSSFMQHIPSIDMLIVETDRNAAEAVYEDVRELAVGRTALLRPTDKECRLYAAGTPSLIVRDLISEAPTMSVDGVTTASLEKILVDVTIAPEFEFARGSELYTIYENADQMYRIGKKTMLRYAARRGKREEIAKLIESTML
jgi:hypothetical protein